MNALKNVEGRLGFSPNQDAESSEASYDVPPSSYGISRMGLLPPVDSEQGVVESHPNTEAASHAPEIHGVKTTVHEWKRVSCSKKTFKIPPILNQRLKEYCRRKGCYEYEVIDRLLQDFFRTMDTGKEAEGRAAGCSDVWPVAG